MTRALPEKYRLGRSIQPGWELHRLHENDWRRVVARDDEHGAVFGLQIKLTLDGGDVFYVQPAARYMTRRAASVADNKEQK